MKVIKISNGIIHVADKGTNCLFCHKEYSAIECCDLIGKSKNGNVEFTCECKNKIGITCLINGDFLCYYTKPRGKIIKMHK